MAVLDRAFYVFICSAAYAIGNSRRVVRDTNRLAVVIVMGDRESCNRACALSPSTVQQLMSQPQWPVNPTAVNRSLRVVAWTTCPVHRVGSSPVVRRASLA